MLINIIKSSENLWCIFIDGKIIYLEKCEKNVTKMDECYLIKPKKRSLWTWRMFRGSWNCFKILFQIFMFYWCYTRKKRTSWNESSIIIAWKKWKWKLKNFHMCRIYNCNDWFFFLSLFSQQNYHKNIESGI